MNLWRISNHVTLSGEGGMRASARWHSRGRPIVYLAESPAGAMLETLVHLQGRRDRLPRTYTLLAIVAPDIVSIERIISTDTAWKKNLLHADANFIHVEETITDFYDERLFLGA